MMDTDFKTSTRPIRFIAAKTALSSSQRRFGPSSTTRWKGYQAATAHSNQEAAILSNAGERPTTGFYGTHSLKGHCAKANSANLASALR
jgi:hypothetical protein